MIVFQAVIDMNRNWPSWLTTIVNHHYQWSFELCGPRTSAILMDNHWLSLYISHSIITSNHSPRPWYLINDQSSSANHTKTLTLNNHQHIHTNHQPSTFTNHQDFNHWHPDHQHSPTIGVSVASWRSQTLVIARTSPAERTKAATQDFRRDTATEWWLDGGWVVVNGGWTVVDDG